MKYCKVWKHQKSKLPVTLRDSVLSYKKWKELSKQPMGANDLILLLESECLTISKIMKETIKIKSPHPIISIIMAWCRLPNFSKRHAIANCELYTYAVLNKLTLYKICKRMDKRRGTNTFRQWYTKRYNDFYFNASAYLTHLKIVNKVNEVETYECPVCFEEIEDAPFMILNCGHLLCVDCVESMYGMKGKKGTFQNLISVRETSKKMYCPTCRYPNPLSRASRINMYPQHDQLLFKINH